jgi:predicted nucleic acid-binding protein
VITFDTSGIIALFNRQDSDHSRAVSVVRDDPGPLVVPAGILGEIAYMLERWAQSRNLDDFLRSIEEGHFLLDCGEQDIARIRQLAGRYEDLPLGFADAAVIACAERHGGRVLTYDVRDFSVVAREGTITVVTSP